MLTDLNITGRPAQFGRGVMTDVGDKLLGQFAACVASKLGGEPAQAETSSGASSATGTAAGAGAGSSSGSAATGTSAVAAPAAPTTSSSNGSTAAQPAVAETKPTASSAPMKSEIDAIDLLDTAGAPVLKRLAPAIGGGLLLVLVILLVRRHPFHADRRRQRHVAALVDGLIEHRPMKGERQRDLAALALALHRGVELAEEADLALVAETDDVAGARASSPAGRRPPARAVEPLDERRLDPRLGVAADAPPVSRAGITVCR